MNSLVDLTNTTNSSQVILLDNSGRIAHDDQLKFKFELSAKRLDSTTQDAFVVDDCLIACGDFSNNPPFSNLQWTPLKRFLRTVNQSENRLLIRSFHWFNWSVRTRYCSRCGEALSVDFSVVEKTCGACSETFFPRFSPAIMVLIYRDNEILLARSSHFNPGVYSAIAGFVELGESAEEALHREVKEELGIQVTDLNYFGSQTWPFPDSFMIAFNARYLSGELSLDDDEIEDAAWFTPNNLPNLPSKASIARQLIERYLLENH